MQPLLQLTLPANLVRFKLSHYEGITYRILMNDADILVLVCAVTVMRYVALLSFSVFQEVDEDSDSIDRLILEVGGRVFLPTRKFPQEGQNQKSGGSEILPPISLHSGCTLKHIKRVRYNFSTAIIAGL